MERVLSSKEFINRKSEIRIANWVDSIKNNLGNDLKIPIVVIGNKIDLEDREVKTEDAESFCKKINVPYFETSAKTGENIDNSIRSLVKKVLNTNSDNQGENNAKSNIKINTEEHQKKEKSGCGC